MDEKAEEEVVAAEVGGVGSAWLSEGVMGICSWWTVVAAAVLLAVAMATAASTTELDFWRLKNLSSCRAAVWAVTPMVCLTALGCLTSSAAAVALAMAWSRTGGVA